MSFSYNASLINSDSIITFNASEIRVEKAISEVFDRRIKAKFIGSHIVLIESRQFDKKIAKSSAPVEYHFKGKVVNAQNGRPISNANIYDLSQRHTVLTDSLGQFEYAVMDYPEMRYFNVAKSSFIDTVISINGSETNAILIFLKPNIELSKIESKRQKDLLFLQSNKLALSFVPEVGMISAQNLINVYEHRFGQVSLVPIVGTNYKSGSIIENNVSLNVIAGYNGGVNGIEIGGFLNIISRDVLGFQISGAANVVAGKTSGMQVAGVLNKTNKKISGFQVAGVMNWGGDSLGGVQLSGVTNFISGKVKGVQLSGVNNFSTKKVSGLQISGINNFGNENVDGAQIGGIVNGVNRNLNGVQIAGIVNTVRSDMRGLQVSLFNQARTNKGLQVGLINVSDSSNGAAIGLLNLVKNGYKALELSANEVFFLNLGFKSGADHFYTIYSLGLGSTTRSIQGVGFGFGSKVELPKRFSMSVNATTNYIFEQPYKRGEDLLLNLNNRFSVTAEYSILKHFAVFAGPAYNIHLSQLYDENSGQFTTDIAKNPFYTRVKNGTQIQMWIGGEVGLRYQF